MPMYSRGLAQTLVVSRSSAGTYVGPDGLIKITTASKNLLLHSQNATDTGWAILNGANLASSATTAPDGSATVTKIIKNANTSDHYTGQFVTTSQGIYTYSAYLKAAEFSFVRMHVENSTFTGSVRYYVDLSTGQILGPATTGTGLTLLGYESQDAGNGWFRLRLTFNYTSGTAVVPRVYTTDSSGNTSVLGDAVKGFYIWGAQLESGSNMTNHERTGNGTHPARIEYDPVTLQMRGILIEEQRTNLITYSQAISTANGYTRIGGTCIVTPDVAVAPDGTQTAGSVAWASGGNSGTGRGGIAVTAGGSYVASVYLKKGSGSDWVVLILYGASGSYRAWVNLTTGAVSGAALAGVYTNGATFIENMGSGWWRFTLAAVVVTDTTVTVEVNQASASGNYTAGSGDVFYIWGLQLENTNSSARYPTSYIPTAASTATRTQDLVQVKGLQFSNFFSLSAGTLVIEAIPKTFPWYRNLATLDQTPGHQSKHTGYNNNARGSCGVVFTGDAVTTNSFNPLAVNKSAYTYDGSTPGRVCLNGGAVAASTNAMVSSAPNVLTVGLGAGGGFPPIGWIRSIKYYNFKMTDTQMQEATL